MYDEIIRIILNYFPDLQAIYLFGSYGTAEEWPDSDIDIAVLLAPQQAKETGVLAWGEPSLELEMALEKEIDLINLRRVPTTLQKEVIAAERRIYCADEYAADEFEMLVISYYQRLNAERAEIIQDMLETGRFIAS